MTLEDGGLEAYRERKRQNLHLESPHERVFREITIEKWLSPKETTANISEETAETKRRTEDLLKK